MEFYASAIPRYDKERLFFFSYLFFVLPLILSGSPMYHVGPRKVNPYHRLSVGFRESTSWAFLFFYLLFPLSLSSVQVSLTGFQYSLIIYSSCWQLHSQVSSLKRFEKDQWPYRSVLSRAFHHLHTLIIGKI